MILLSLAALFTQPASAAPESVDLTVPVYLRDSSGSPIDGSATITLAVFDVATGGTSIHAETSTETLTAGAAEVTLGLTDSLWKSSATGQASQDRWIELSSEGAVAWRLPLDNSVEECTSGRALWAVLTDADGDGFGADAGFDLVCNAPTAWTYPGDCDDTADGINPAAAEVCDGIDNACRGSADLNAIDETTWYEDEDGDGFGGLDAGFCDDPGAGWSEVDGDCDDLDADVNPDADELCDEVDHNCDGDLQADAVDLATWYDDIDEDGLGDPDTEQTGCEAPNFAIDNGDDCDDADPEVGATCPEAGGCATLPAPGGSGALLALLPLLALRRRR